MSSSSLSTRRQIWSNQHPLRKQRSSIDGGIITHTSGILGRSDRGKYSLLQKQFSVDHVYSTGARQGRFNVRCSDSKQSIVNKNKSGGQWTIERSESSDLGLSVFQKNKQLIKSYGEVRKDKVVGDRLRRAKGSEDRINLNIFLAHTAPATDYDGNSSDLESPSESFDIVVPEKKTPEKPPRPAEKPNPVVAEPKRPPSAATRRAQFKASRPVQNTTVGPTALLSALPSSLTIERRPPLVRAMSAPVRTLDENSKNIIANKRKSRRRKILTRNPSCDKSNVIEPDFDENEENVGEKGRGKNNKKTSGRAKSALGCDVVTLVSLISSEESDSEKEDSIPPDVEIPIRRAPLLRKTGKSVSFQENEPSNFVGPNKEFSQVLRRGSIAPLAARIRANRPPTAPAGSIFVGNLEISKSKMTEENKNSIKDEPNGPNTPEQSESKENESDTRPEVPEKQFPKYVRSLKERECWKLFLKMSNKGVAVSYDTISRGLLTPTEFRVLQKQKEVEETKRLAEEQTNIELEGNKQ